MITNGKDKLLSANPGSLPNLSGAMQNWTQQITFTVITKSTVNFVVKEVETDYTCPAIVQPFTSKQLQMKPEGQRAWNWQRIHSDIGLQLTTDDRVKFLGTKYRVMQKWDYSQYGYVEYDVVEDYD